MSGSLLESVRGLIERTYRIRSGLTEIGPFVIGDLGQFFPRGIENPREDEMPFLDP